MPTYVALLRGIMPSNPKTRSVSLKQSFEALGFARVQTVIGSGNVVFESKAKDTSVLERQIERGLPERLGCSLPVMMRSQAQMERLIASNPFKGITDEKPNYLVVTFFKDNRPEVATAIDLDKVRGPEMMNDLLKKYGREITTRTWKTVHRIQEKMLGAPASFDDPTRPGKVAKGRPR